MSYEERRVRVRNYGVLPRSSPLLVEIPGTRGKPRRLHKLAAAAFKEMAAAVLAELDGTLELAAASGWRRHRWESWEDYEATMIRKYGSVREGRKWLAYNSPHETGLAVDFGVGGLEPSRRTAAHQRTTKLHGWLKENAYRFGWHPYKREPWHWEFPLSKQAWETGVATVVADGEVPEGLGPTRGFSGPISFGDDEYEDFEGVEDLDDGDVAWFSDDGDEGGDDGGHALSLPRAGEVSGEIEAGDGRTFRLRWEVRWRFDES